MYCVIFSARILDSVILFFSLFVVDFLVRSMVSFSDLEDDDDDVAEMSVRSCKFSSSIFLLGLISFSS